MLVVFGGLVVMGSSSDVMYDVMIMICVRFRWGEVE